MARLKRFARYKDLERPYTRISKYRKKSYIKANPNKVIVRYDMGDVNKKFPCTLNLLSKTGLQIRHNAIESARQSSNRLLVSYSNAEKNIANADLSYSPV